MTTTTEPQPETKTPQTESPKPDPAKPEALYFETKAERENYYRWVYCVKNGITDMEPFGVKPLDLPGGSTSPATVNSASPVSPAVRGRKPGNTIDLEMTPAMVTATCIVLGAMKFTGKVFRWTWNFFAMVTAIVIFAMLLGVATA